MAYFRRLSAALLIAAMPVGAKPLITSSEETLARICIAGRDSPVRLIEACEQALSDATLTTAQHVELLVALGDAHFWNDDNETSLEVYRRAVALDGATVDGWNGIGWALRATEGDAAALKAFETSLTVSLTVQGLGGKAATSRALGQIDGETAREMLRAALTIDPEYTWAIREIAWSHFDDGQFESAIEVFEEALAVHPDDTNAHYGLGRAALKNDDNARALQAMNDVVERNAENYSAQVYRLIALRELDRNAQAIRDADRLIAAYPDRSSGYIQKGQALMALERRREAIKTYVAAEATIGPNNALLYWHADALTYDGRMNEALEVIERGLALDGADYSDYLLKSYIALELEDYTMAQQAAEASLDTGVEDPWAHYYIAIAMVHGGQTPEGLVRFEKAINRGLPSHRVGAFAKELISVGKFVEAAQLRLKY